MTDVTDDQLHPQIPSESTVQPKPNLPAEPPEERRKFFAHAMGEMLSPFAGIIERKINPLLRALETLPEEVERRTDQLGVGSHKTAVHLPIAQAPQRILRPPGALPEDEFSAICSRCGICVQVCPAQCIKLDKQGLIGEGHPYIVAAESACVVCDSLACMNNCPTGALKPIDKLQINMGLAKVTHSTCLRHHGEDCRLCVDACTLGETAIMISTESGRVRVKQDGCIGCGLCEAACPTEPRSIVVIPAKPPFEPIVA